MNDQIFISYRRNDSQGSTGRIYDYLIQHFQHSHIFLDVDTIAPGEDFIKSIENAISKCQISLVIIGKNWLEIADGDGVRMLENHSDFVRIEIRAALERNIKVIPVLVENAKMPSEKDLPDDIKLLAGKNALEVRHTSFKNDMNRLLSSLQKSFGEQEIKHEHNKGIPPLTDKHGTAILQPSADSGFGQSPASANQNIINPQTSTPISITLPQARGTDFNTTYSEIERANHINRFRLTLPRIRNCFASLGYTDFKGKGLMLQAYDDDFQYEINESSLTINGALFTLDGVTKVFKDMQILFPNKLFSEVEFNIKVPKLYCSFIDLSSQHFKAYYAATSYDYPYFSNIPYKDVSAIFSFKDKFKWFGPFGVSKNHLMHVSFDSHLKDLISWKIIHKGRGEIPHAHHFQMDSILQLGFQKIKINFSFPTDYYDYHNFWPDPYYDIFEITTNFTESHSVLSAEIAVNSPLGQFKYLKKLILNQTFHHESIHKTQFLISRVD
jgi:TIR domain